MTDKTDTPEIIEPALPDMPPPPAPNDDAPKADGGTKSRRRTPKASTSPSTPRRGPGRPPKAKRDLTDDVMGIYAMIGSGVMLVNLADGAAILDGAEAAAKSVNDLAQHNPRIHAAIENMLAASVIGAVVTAHAPIVLKILANHGALPPVAVAMLGGTPTLPDTNGDGASHN